MGRTPNCILKPTIKQNLTYQNNLKPEKPIFRLSRFLVFRSIAFFFITSHLTRPFLHGIFCVTLPHYKPLCIQRTYLHSKLHTELLPLLSTVLELSSKKGLTSMGRASPRDPPQSFGTDLKKAA